MFDFVKRLFFISAILFSSVGYAEENYKKDLPISKVNSSSKQSKISPQDALQRLKDGNKRFTTNNLISYDFLQQAKVSAFSQYPYAVILNCMDSRSAPEFLFNQGIADLFTLRVAGNVLNKDILGSLEFATKAVGASLIVVMGHTGCGAVVGACAGVKLGSLTSLLNKISPLVPAAKKSTEIKDCYDDKLIDAIAKDNAMHVAKQISKQSKIIRNLVSKGDVSIIAAMHDLKTGQVTFFDMNEPAPKKA